MSTPPIPTPERAGDRSPYAGRPWLNQYPAGLPSTITPDHGTMLALFESWIARSPSDVAVKYFDGTISVAELDRRSNALAMTLQQTGFAPGIGSRCSCRTIRPSWSGYSQRGNSAARQY